MVYQQPLAYLLGIEGMALLRAYGGEYDRAFTEARLAEVRRLLDCGPVGGEGVEAERIGTVDGYRIWSETYDEPRNGLFDFDEPYVHKILDALPAGTALDAACGTGRYAEYLAGLGHRVLGVDSSPDMLARARDRVPDGDFRDGDLHRLPVGDGEVDVVVCALALAHVAELGPVMAEFARVLRPNGHLVISDVHAALVFLGSVPCTLGRGGQPGLLPGHRHLASDYLGAALPLGLHLRHCEEPRLPDSHGEREEEPETELGPWDLWPWALHGFVPDATRAAYRGLPATVIWHFQRAPG